MVTIEQAKAATAREGRLLDAALTAEIESARRILDGNFGLRQVGAHLAQSAAKLAEINGKMEELSRFRALLEVD